MATTDDGTPSGGMVSRIGSATDSIPNPLGGEEGSSDRTTSAAADSDAADGGSLLGRLLGGVASAIRFVVTDVWRYVKTNDVDLEFSDHRLQIEGDGDGIDTFQAELAGLVAGRDLAVHYRRDDGVDVELERLSDRRPLSLSF